MSERCCVCDDETPKHHICSECGYDRMCLQCATEGQRHYCSVCTVIRKPPKRGKPGRTIGTPAKQSVQTVAEFVMGLDASGKTRGKG